jgi:hypothetical protein
MALRHVALKKAARFALWRKTKLYTKDKSWNKARRHRSDLAQRASSTSDDRHRRYLN